MGHTAVILPVASWEERSWLNGPPIGTGVSQRIWPLHGFSRLLYSLATEVVLSGVKCLGEILSEQASMQVRDKGSEQSGTQLRMQRSSASAYFKSEA